MSAIEVKTANQFKKHVSESDVPVVVYFHAPWWGFCGPAGRAVDKAVAATKGKVALIKVNIDDAGKLADQQGIEYVPTIRLHRHGCPISQLETKPTLKVLVEWINEYLALKPARKRKNG